MIFELFEDTAKMSFIVFCLYAGFRAYVLVRQPAWSMLLERRHRAILSALVLAVLALKFTDDVLGVVVWPRHLDPLLAAGHHGAHDGRGD